MKTKVKTTKQLSQMVDEIYPDVPSKPVECSERMLTWKELMDLL